MSHPAADNIATLAQGIELIESIDDTVFVASPDGLRIGGVGSQVRHCIDFYVCFLRGLETGSVDYNERDREVRVESERHRAIESIRGILERLESIPATAAAERLEVHMDPSEARPGGGGPYDSTLGRELQFLLSHTIHHYALIVTLLKLQGVDLGVDFATFGVAPSTLRYWKETGILAG